MELEIREQINFEKATRSNTRFGHAIIELFSRKYIRRTAIAIMVLQVGILSGSLAIQNYQSLLYSSLGFTGQKAILISGCYGLMGVVGQLINLVGVSDRWPRVRTMCESISESYISKLTNPSRHRLFHACRHAGHARCALGPVR
jgi:uncharacterized membrane protein